MTCDVHVEPAPQRPGSDGKDAAVPEDSVTDGQGWEDWQALGEILEARRLERSVRREPRLWFGLLLAMSAPVAESLRYLLSWTP